MTWSSSKKNWLMVAKMCLECIRNNEESTTHFLHSCVSISSVVSEHRQFHRPFNQCCAAECRWVYSMFLDDKSLCNQAVAQLHIWLILSFWRTADKMVPVLQHTSDRARVFCALAARGRGLKTCFVCCIWTVVVQQCSWKWHLQNMVTIT